MCMLCESVQACVQCYSECSESTRVLGVETEAVGMEPLLEVSVCGRARLWPQQPGEDRPLMQIPHTLCFLLLSCPLGLPTALPHSTSCMRAAQPEN